MKKGYHTIEISIIMPIFITIFILLFSFLSYLYQINFITSELNKSCDNLQEILFIVPNNYINKMEKGEINIKLLNKNTFLDELYIGVDIENLKKIFINNIKLNSGIEIENLNIKLNSNLIENTLEIYCDINVKSHLKNFFKISSKKFFYKNKIKDLNYYNYKSNIDFLEKNIKNEKIKNFKSYINQFLNK